jgi:hypothetical protein
MKTSPRPPRKPSELSESLQHHLGLYALAASAAGVGVMALAQLAEAKIIYTPLHHVMHDGSSYDLDFTGKGTKDLTIENQHYATCTPDGGACWTGEWLYPRPRKGNGVVRTAWQRASAMQPGDVIGPQDSFSTSFPFMVVSGQLCSCGNWINVKNRYLGVKFKIKGQYHYGWARLNVNVYKEVITATLSGYAYETIANKAIVAGKTKGKDQSPEQASPGVVLPSGALGRLALGRK